MPSVGKLEEAHSVRAFFASPAGRCVSRAHFAYIGASDMLLSLVIWGHIGPSDVAELIDVLTIGAKSKRRDALVQMQALRGVDEESLRGLSRFMAQSLERSHSVTRREAIVRPAGTMGMIVAGFYGVVPVKYPTAIFTERDDALAWLRVPARARRQLAADSDALLLSASSRSDVVYRTRELLAGAPKTSDIAIVAARVGVSARTLQRRLAEADTSFERELGLARLTAAKNLLLRTTAPIKEVAHEVGLPNASRLSQLFAEHEGTSPREWRARAAP